MINGSMSKNSNTKIVLTDIKQLLTSQGCETLLVSVRDMDLPTFDPDEDLSGKILNKLQIIKNADAIIIGSPEYHGDYTGALKNMLDYLTKDDLSGKVTGLVSTSGSKKCGLNTLNSLRVVLRNLHAHVITQQVSICEEEIDFTLQTVRSKNVIKEFVRGLLLEMDLRSSAINHISSFSVYK